MLFLHTYWVDLFIILVLIVFIHHGFINGFWSILIDFISFLASLLLSLKLYPIISPILKSAFSLSLSTANAISFLISAIFIEVTLGFVLSFLISKLPQKILKNHITKILGIILSVGQAIILIAFALTLTISLPINPSVKTDISKSRLGGIILTKTSGIEKSLNGIFGGAINDSLTSLTVEPASHESIALDNSGADLSIDRESENEMFALLNKERTDRGLMALTWDVKLVVVGENYAKKLWNEHYFGHYDKDGHDAAFRLQSAGINYSVAGENLALAASVSLAHTGLMNSPAHKANILETRFKKVGIGVVDNGYYGKMFVQVFTD